MREEKITLEELRERVTGNLTGADKAGQLAKLIAQVEAHPDFPEAERATTLKRLRDITDRLSKMTGMFADKAAQKEPVKEEKLPKTMEQGVVGLFPNPDGVHCFNIRDGDTGLPLEDILPENMRGAGYAKAPIADYINQLYIWLSSFERWDAAQKAIAPELERVRGTGKGVNFQPPVFDVDDLEILKPDGSIEYPRLRDLCLLVTPYWDKSIQPGLIVGMIKTGATIKTMKSMLAKMAPLMNEGKSAKEILDDLNSQPDVKFINLFLPLDYHKNPDNYPPPEEVLGYIGKWIRSTTSSNAITKTKLAWQMDLRQLEVLNAKGKLDEKRARLIGNYIWSRRDEKPGFLKLIKWLRDEVDGHKITQEKQRKKAHQGQVSKARTKAKKSRKKAKKNRRK